MKKETLDFIQVDYALDNRNAGERILPLAADRGMAVRGQVQGQELYRHRNLSSGRSSGCLVLCRPGFSGTRHHWDLSRCRPTFYCMGGQ
jgi:hypothetical protein